MQINEITSQIEKLAPTKLAYDFDNVGLLVGDKNAEAKKVLLCLDMDDGVAEEAANIGAQLVIGHHPVMFSAVKRITEDSYESRAIRTLIKNNISYYAAHTNLDVAKGGLNDLLAEKLGVKNTSALSPIEIDGEGIGRIGMLESETTLGEYMELIKNVLKCDGVRYCGNKDDKIRLVAVNTGGGTSLIDDAIQKRADVFVTGDFRYNQMRDCIFSGLDIIDVGHFSSEVIIEELFSSLLKSAFGDSIEIVISKASKNVMKFA